jgi:hypothetical protein
VKWDQINIPLHVNYWRDYAEDTGEVPHRDDVDLPPGEGRHNFPAQAPISSFPK